MPFYEYQCKSCGHTLEAMQKVNDAPLRKCPDCGKSQLTRLMSAPVFRLKGGGWYETDFKGDQDNKRNLADRPEAEPAKDDKKPAADATSSEASSKDGSGKDGSGKDGGGKDGGGKDAAKPADKTADKPADKAVSTESAKKPVGRSSAHAAAARPTTARSTPSRTSSAARAGSARPAPKKAAKKPAAKARRRG